MKAKLRDSMTSSTRTAPAAPPFGNGHGPLERGKTNFPPWHKDWRCAAYDARLPGLRCKTSACLGVMCRKQGVRVWGGGGDEYCHTIPGRIGITHRGNTGVHDRTFYAPPPPVQLLPDVLDPGWVLSLRSPQARKAGRKRVDTSDVRTMREQYLVILAKLVASVY